MKPLTNLLAWSLALGCTSALATDRPPDAAKSTTATQGQLSSRADNTNINERDQSGTSKTPQDQNNRKQDITQLAAVRRAVTADKSLSTMARNVKILVTDGVVTLRGPVKNAEERVRVEAIAKQVRGITETVNQLDVKAAGTNQ